MVYSFSSCTYIYWRIDCNLYQIVLFLQEFMDSGDGNISGAAFLEEQMGASVEIEK